MGNNVGLLGPVAQKQSDSYRPALRCVDWIAALPDLEVENWALNGGDGSNFLQLAPPIAPGVRIRVRRMSPMPKYPHAPMPCQAIFMLLASDREDRASRIA